MAEQDTISTVPAPITQAGLLSDLRAMGIARGDTVIVHTAMSKIGWVCGREAAVVQALLRAVGKTGILVMPAHTGDNSNPADWSNPPVPAGWFDPIRENMPAYDRRITASRGIGRVAECFRTYPGTQRSAHPHVSWCARGIGARLLLRGHTYRKPCFGMASPLGRLYRRNAKILLIGVGYGNCTALHLAETLCPNTPTMGASAAVRAHGIRRWLSWSELDFDSDRFPQLGQAYEQSGGVALTGKLGAADCKLLRVKPLVDFGVAWLTANPRPAEEEAAQAGITA